MTDKENDGIVLYIGSEITKAIEGDYCRICEQHVDGGKLEVKHYLSWIKTGCCPDCFKP